MQNEKLDTLALGDRDYPEGWRSLPNRPYLIFAKGNRSILSEPRQSILAVDYSNWALDLALSGTLELLDSVMMQSPNLVLAADVDSNPWNALLLARAVQAGHRIIAVATNIAELGFPRWAKRNIALREACEAGKGIILNEYPDFLRSKDTIPSAMAARLVTGLAGALLVPAAQKNAPESGAVFSALSAGIPVWCTDYYQPGEPDASLHSDLLRQGKAKLATSAGEVLYSMFQMGKKQTESYAEPEPER